jgi:hypothetical protein
MTEVNSLSIIESVDISSIESTTRKINDFQAIVKKNLKKDKDYGIIPGCSKPTLLKPGAEKILMLMGLQSTYEIIDSTRDWKEGFFQYQVRCTLEKGGIVITQGLGCCNSREKKYNRQDPYSIDNTILKMAKKRSQVDASLTVASLSEIFTQDVEDMGLHDKKQSIDFATQPQVTLIKKQIISSHLLTKPELEKISGYLENGITKAKASEIIGWWLGGKDIEGEHNKREKLEKAKPKVTKKDKLETARRIVKDKGKVEVREEAFFPDEEILPEDMPE